jgi:hypothetical protein
MVSNSAVTGNSVSLATNLPSFADGQLINMHANPGVSM